MRKSKTGIILAAAMLAFTTAFSACTNSSSESYETESNPVIADSEGGTGNADRKVGDTEEMSQDKLRLWQCYNGDGSIVTAPVVT